MTKSDPAIESIRSARRRISQEFDHDPARLVAHYIEYQKKFVDRVLVAASPDEGLDPADTGEEGVAPIRP